MTPSPIAAKTPARRAWSWSLLWLLPPLCWLIAGAVWSLVEYRQGRWVDARLAELRAVGELPTAAQRTEQLWAESQTEGLVEWNRVTQALSAAFSQSSVTDWLTRWQVTRNGDPLPRELDPEPLEQLISELRPLIDRAIPLLEQPRPIWTPMALHRKQLTYVYNSDLYGLPYFVVLDVLLGIRKNDRSRILEGLVRLEQVWRQETDRRIGYSFNTLIEQENVRLNLLTQCLDVPGWTSEELEQLRLFARQPADIASVWRQQEQFQRLRLLEGDARFLPMPDISLLSSRLEMPTSIRALAIQTHKHNNQEPAWDNPEQTASELMRRSAVDYWTSGLTMQYGNERWLQSVALRRKIQTGLALRKFKLTFGRWPAALRELTEVGAKPSDWRSPTGVELGYRRTPGDEVVVLYWREYPVALPSLPKASPQASPTSQNSEIGHVLITDYRPY